MTVFLGLMYIVISLSLEYLLLVLYKFYSWGIVGAEEVWPEHIVPKHWSASLSCREQPRCPELWNMLLAEIIVKKFSILCAKGHKSVTVDTLRCLHLGGSTRPISHWQQKFAPPSKVSSRLFCLQLASGSARPCSYRSFSREMPNFISDV